MKRAKGSNLTSDSFYFVIEVFHEVIARMRWRDVWICGVMTSGELGDSIKEKSVVVLIFLNER